MLAVHLGLHYIKQTRSVADLKALIFVGSMGAASQCCTPSTDYKLILDSIVGGGSWGPNIHSFETLSFRCHEVNPCFLSAGRHSGRCHTPILCWLVIHISNLIRKNR